MTQQSSLFATDSERELILYATNRSNLMRILAAGLVMPLAGFSRKYYADLLEVCPGRLPILRGNVGALVGHVASETEDVAVALEISSEWLTSDPISALMADGSNRASAFNSPDAVAWAPAGVLPTAAIRAIHVRSDREREELDATQYRDVPDFGARVMVSPSIFEVSPSHAPVHDWLRGLAEVPDPDAARIDDEDRRAGALLMYSQYVESPEALEELGSLLTGEQVSGDGFAARVHVWRSELRQSNTPDAALLDIAIDVFGGVDRRSAWKPRSIVDALTDRSRALADTASRRSAEQALARARDIVANDAAFEGFKLGGSPVLKAVLLALLRPEPEQIARTSTGELGIDAPVLALAAGLCGVMSGRSMIPAAQRPEKLDRLLTLLEGDRLRPRAEGILARQSLRSAVVSKEPGEGERIGLRIDGDLVAHFAAAPPAATADAFDPAARPDLAVEMATALGWADSIRTIVSASDCRVELVFTPGNFSATVITFHGVPAITRELDLERFRERLAREVIPADWLARLSGSPAPAPQGAAAPSPAAKRQRASKRVKAKSSPN